MKTIKGNALGILVSFSILFGSCVSPPEFSFVPTIKPPKTGPFVEFKPGLNTDSLIVNFDFEDGDGDLGLSPTQTDDPYHPFFVFLANEGDTIPLATARDPETGRNVVIVPNGAVGKIFTHHTLEQAPYQNFHPVECPYFRTEYLRDSIFVEEADKHIFDFDQDTHTFVGTIERGDNDLYILRDTFLIKQNPNHYNVEVEFWVKNNDNSFSLYDWKKELCVSQDFSQRFPFLTDTENPLSGTLKYAMTSVGFRLIFSGRTLKLKVRIRDRALHTSKWLETPEFTIQ